MLVSRNLDDIKFSARAEIDARSEVLRLGYITNGSGQALIYQEKDRQARECLQIISDGGTPVTTDFPFITVDQAVNGVSMLQACQTIVDLSNQWRQIGSAIEVLRLTAKRGVDAATSVTEIDSFKSGVTQAALDAMISA